MPRATRDRWLDLAGQICAGSQQLEHLVVKNTATSAEQGLGFLQELADSEVRSLRHIDLSGGKQVIISKGNKQEFVNSYWFDGSPQEPVDLLTAALARQTYLEKLVLEYCAISIDQKDQILDALAGRHCEVVFATDDKRDAKSHVVGTKSKPKPPPPKEEPAQPAKEAAATTTAK